MSRAVARLCSLPLILFFVGYNVRGENACPCVPCYNSVDEYIASEKEDLESYKADLEEALEELKDMRADWKPEKEPNMDEEIELIKKWVKEREDFINE